MIAASADAQNSPTLNEPADGYRGIWYMNQPSGDEYVYKYSGGLGTYCEYHRPFAIYCPQVEKTFFCYGGATRENSRQLLHMVGYYDHQTKTVPRPTILLDKQTDDAHDNPVLSVDTQGYIWIFSTSHGQSRPSYVHRSVRPYDHRHFQQIDASYLSDGQPRPLDNFSYLQAWHSSDRGFQVFFTRYNDPAARTLCFMSSADGYNWSSWQRLAAIEQGHYQVSGRGKVKLGTMFNYHPKGKGLNWRTNLYYMESTDDGRNWKAANGRDLTLPLYEVKNDALALDYASQQLNVYIKDLRFDEQDNPLMLYVTSRGYESGPKNDPRTWRLARWHSDRWIESEITTSDNNYDAGELFLLTEDDWRLIAPTTDGAQAYNPGGEIAVWQSRDQGANWSKMQQLTHNSPVNHNYVRRVVDGHPDFVAIWADGHGRQPSESRLYFSDASGNLYQLPTQMSSESARPILISGSVH